jgi:hypothetical protein
LEYSFWHLAAGIFLATDYFLDLPLAAGIFLATDSQIKQLGESIASCQ